MKLCDASTNHKKTLFYTRILTGMLIVMMLLVLVLPKLSIKAASTPSGISEETLKDKIWQYVEPYLKDKIPGASIVVAKDGQVLLSEGYGYADFDKKSAINPESSLYEYGAASKIFVWIAVMQLLEQDRIDLNADIMTYLPDDFQKELSKKLTSKIPVTMMHLMNNTVGFEERELDMEFNDSTYLSGNLKEALLLTMPNQVYEPGEAMAYSSYGAALAAYIIECISKETYDEYVKKHILEPLGIVNVVMEADYSTNQTVSANKVTGYSTLSDGTFEPTFWTYHNLYPSMGVQGSTMELAKVVMSLMPAKGETSLILKEETIKQMLKKTYSITEDATGISHGLYQFPADVESFYIDGGTIGYGNMVVMVPSERLVIAISANIGNSTEFMYGINDLLLNSKEYTAPVPGENLPSVDFVTGKSYIGARRPVTNLLEMFGYFLNCTTITRVDSNTIAVGGREYIQVSPYVFEIKDPGDNIILKTAARQIHFKMNDYIPVKWSYGGISNTEYLLMEGYKSQSFLLFSLFSFLTFLLVGFAMFVASLWNMIKAITKKTINFAMGITYFRLFVLFSYGLLINTFFLMAKLLSSVNVMEKTAQPRIIANWVFAILAFISLILAAVVKTYDRPKKWQLIISGLYIILFIGMLYLLTQWNLFTLL